MTLHELPADSRRTQQGNLDDLISQAGLLKSLRDGNNLLYE